jgi:hypothetical protein
MYLEHVNITPENSRCFMLIYYDVYTGDTKFELEL